MPHKLIKLLALAPIPLALFVTHAEARAINKLKLSEGYTEVNTLEGPVLEGSGVGPIAFSEFAETFDRGERMFRRRSGFMRGGLKAKLGPAVRPGALLASCLESEAERMGLPVGEGGWRIGGTITELYFDNDLPSTWAMGVLLFYGSLTVDLEINSPEGQVSSTTLRLHHYSVQGGMNALKSARDALATLLIEGAQEIVVHLNRAHFHAPPHADVASKVDRLREAGLLDQEGLIHAVGLSGSADAVAALAELLRSEKDEGRRFHAINALANIASPDAIPVLGERYSTEDDDCRWATLKAMAYIGTDAALEVVRKEGLADREPYYRSVAEKILAN